MAPKPWPSSPTPGIPVRHASRGPPAGWSPNPVPVMACMSGVLTAPPRLVFLLPGSGAARTANVPVLISGKHRAKGPSVISPVHAPNGSQARILPPARTVPGVPIHGVLGAGRRSLVMTHLTARSCCTRLQPGRRCSQSSWVILAAPSSGVRITPWSKITAGSSSPARASDPGSERASACISSSTPTYNGPVVDLGPRRPRLWLGRYSVPSARPLRRLRYQRTSVPDGKSSTQPTSS